MQSRIALRQGSRSGFDELLDTLTDAFASDPLWGGWAFPNRDVVERKRRALFGLWLDEALEYGCVLATKEYEAVAMWYPPSVRRGIQEQRNGLAAVAAVLGLEEGRSLQACAQLESAHPQQRAHYYLCLLGTRREARGQRWGRRLLEGSLELLDATGMPAYLDSTNPINRRLYEALAFEIIGSVQLPDEGPRIDLMWREPEADRASR